MKITPRGMKVLGFIAVAALYACGGMHATAQQAEQTPAASSDSRSQDGSQGDSTNATTSNNSQPPASVRTLLDLNVNSSTSNTKEETYFCGAMRPIDGDPDPSMRRPRINGDYFVLVYDAKKHETSWYDYRSPNNLDNKIANSGRAFLPVIYSREKIAVHVCNLHISDALTVTMSPNSLPENGADFRGMTASAIALSPTTDVLASSGATGGSVSPGTLGFGVPALPSSIAVSGYTAGAANAKGGASSDSYQDASFTISPRQLAYLMYITGGQIASLEADIAAFRFGPNETAEFRQLNRDRQSIQLDAKDFHPGGESIHDLDALAEGILGDLSLKFNLQNIEDHRPYSPRPELMNNPGEFNEFVDRTNAFVGEMNAMGGALSAAGLGNRAVTIRQNVASLMGVLDIAQGVIDVDGGKISNCPPKAVLAPTDPKAGPTPAKWQPTADTPDCRRDEMAYMKNFLADYKSELQMLDMSYGNEADFRWPEEKAERAFEQVKDLHEDLRKLDQYAASLFSGMNDYYENSRMEQTDVLTPAGTNAVERISILVHQTYVPYSLVGSAQSAASSSSGGSGGGGATAGGGSGSGGSGGSGGGATTTVSSSAYTAETVLVEVHRKANFNLVGGGMAIRIPTNSYSITSQLATQETNTDICGSPTADKNCTSNPYVYPAMCNNGNPTNLNILPTGTNWPASAPYYCVVQQQSSGWQVAGMAGIAIFPLGKDYFPYGSGGHWFLKENWKPSVVAATSVTSLGSFFGGMGLEPINGLNIFAGVSSGHRTVLPASESLTTPLLPVGSSNSPPTIATATQEKWGLTVGVGFDFTVFTQLIGKPSNPALP